MLPFAMNLIIYREYAGHVWNCERDLPFTVLKVDRNFKVKDRPSQSQNIV